MAFNLNTDPYYDDFDATKNFHQILFKPSLAVQSRELTQLQTILREQIKKFGNHIFQHGSVVIPGNSRADLNVPCIKLLPQYNNSNLILESFDNKIVVGQTSGVEAIVKKTVSVTDTDPITFYVNYTAGGTNGTNAFQDGEEIYVKDASSVRATLQASAATSAGALAYINDGVYYVNGTFVDVFAQNIVISKYSSSPSCHVLLKINEELINYSEDETLLDNAQGSYNYAAPGADRLKISLELTTLPLGSTLSNDYVEIMRYNAGVLEEHSTFPKYNELEKSLARRTYDESGDYVSAGYDTTVKEHLRTKYNGGVYATPTGDIDKLAVVTKPGKAYIKGFEVETIATTTLAIDKARTADHIENKLNLSMTPNFGQFIYVNNLVGTPSFKNRETVTLWNAIPSNGSAVQVGTAKVVAVEYAEPNTTVANAIFKLYVSEVTMTSGSMTSIGGIKFASGSASVLHKVTAPVSGIDFQLAETVDFGTSRSGKVAKWERATSSLYLSKAVTTKEIPIIGDGIVGVTSGATSTVSSVSLLGTLPSTASIVKLPVSNVYRVKTPTNTSNMTYKVVAILDVIGGSASVSGMTIDPIELSTFTITSSTGIVDNSFASLSPDGTTVTVGGSATGMKIICVCTKTNQTPRQKTFISSYVESSVSPATTIQLGKADIHRLISVVSSTDGDVTNRYTLDNGQRDYAYLRGKLTLTGDLPTGTLTITYSYFNHSGTGDYFSIDSYEASGMPTYYANIPTYVSSTGELFDLHNCLDFRPRIGDNGTYTAPSAYLIDMVSPLSRITTAAQIYLGRIDTVVINKSGDIVVLTGIPSEAPVAPTASIDSLPLCTITLAPYTNSVRDVKVKNISTRAYRMLDIAKLESRLYNLEEFSLITKEETALLNTNILDAATGLNRFKSGYLIENFKDPELVGDYFRTGFCVTYDGGEITPAVEFTESRLNIISNTGHLHGVEENGFISLPYTETVFAQQNLSTQVTNVNPFAVVSWVGKLDLLPSSQTYTDIIVLPPIYNVVTNVVTNVVDRVVDVPRIWAWDAPAGARATFAPITTEQEATLIANNKPATAAGFNQLAIDWHVNFINEQVAAGNALDAPHIEIAAQQGIRI